MSQMLRIFCQSCKIEKDIAISDGIIPNVCNKCKTDKVFQDEKHHFIRLNEMTLEKRVL